jgi:hypothetical protein
VFVLFKNQKDGLRVPLKLFWKKASEEEEERERERERERLAKKERSSVGK